MSIVSILDLPQLDLNVHVRWMVDTPGMRRGPAIPWGLPNVRASMVMSWVEFMGQYTGEILPATALLYIAR